MGGITFAIAALVCGAGADCRNRAGAALAFFCRDGGRRRAGALPRRAVPATIRSWRWPRAVATIRSSFVILRCWARCFRRRFAVHWIGRPIGSCCCRSSFRPSISRAAMALVAMLRNAAMKPEKLAVAALGRSRRCRTRRVVALGQHGRRQQRSRAARGVAGASVLIAAAAAGMMLLPRRAVIAATAIAGLVLSLPDTAAMVKLQCRRHAGGGRRGFRANAGAVAGGAPLRCADRARRQQSAVPAGFDAVAGQHVVGAAGEPQLLLCRPRIGAGVGAVIERHARNDQCPVHSRFCRRGHAARRGRHGEKIRLRCRRRRAAGQGLEQRSVRREPRLSPGGKSRRTMADLRGGQGRSYAAR